MVRPPAIDAADSDDDYIHTTKWHRHSEHIVALLLLFVDVL